MSDVTNRLVKCFQAVFPGLEEEDVLRADQDSIAQWDSVAMITLLHVIEERFGISVDFEDLEKLTSFSLISEYVSGHVLSV